MCPCIRDMCVPVCMTFWIHPSTIHVHVIIGCGTMISIVAESLDMERASRNAEKGLENVFSSGKE